MSEERPMPMDDEDIRRSIEALQSESKALETEIRVLRGKLSNRDPKAIEELRRENAELKTRAETLRAEMLALAREANLPKDAAEARSKAEALRIATVEFCRNANIDAEIWKSIES